ncbi:hypothetical protein [Ruegeria sp. EL01]|uniref:hypothetical protein n=1 Tax=Ruegeria sp. EL01 TaxID=2107578 RepID=UPI000EA81633|nr:hypothetical protein [Ruegeria sp. EL01]
MNWKFNADGWTDWIEHDGNGCPKTLIGRVIKVEFKLSQDDGEGGTRGQICYNEIWVSELYASIPEWYDENIGEIFQNPETGENYAAPKITRYCIRKPRGMEILEGALTEFVEAKGVPA